MMNRAPGRAQRFAVCVEVGDYRASLELWKIYRVTPDPDAERHRQIRVVDESGEDYIYPTAWFRPLDLPATLRRLYLSQPVA
jgi:hypothetical protein